MGFMHQYTDIGTDIDIDIGTFFDLCDLYKIRAICF